MRSSITKILCCALLLCLNLAWAARVRLSTQEQPTRITILVVRHGLSCANLIQRWSRNTDLGRYKMLDPPLTGIGQYASVQAGAAVSRWLKQARRAGGAVDATVTSILGRAIETSLLTFSSRRHSRYRRAEVVPFIRDHRSGMPRYPHEDQVQEIRNAVSKQNMTGFHVDYHWADGTIPLSDGSWDNFLAFLANVYLPQTLQRLGKEPGSRLVLAVTTHNKWIQKTMRDKCGLEKKLENNGVLNLEYQFFAHPSSRRDMATTYKLVEDTSYGCNIIHEGSRFTDKQDNFKKMCVADIGDACTKSTLANGYFGSRYLGETLEGQILDLANEMAQSESKIHQWQTMLTRLLKDLRTKGNMGTSNAKEILQKAKELKASLDNEFSKMELRDLPFLQQLKRQPCWSGGYPNVPGYLEQWVNSSDVWPRAERWWLDSDPSLPKRLEWQDEALANISDGTYYSPCLTVYNKNRNFFIRSIRVTESTCNSGLECYSSDGTRTEPGKRGICAVPRTKSCDLSDTNLTYNGWSHGCRPHTECRPSGFWGATCQDVIVKPAPRLALSPNDSHFEFPRVDNSPSYLMRKY